MNPTALTDFLRAYAYQTGADVKVVMDERFGAFAQSMQAQINALVGQDSQFLSVIEQLKALTDAEPGTEGWQAGQNLYQTITARYQESVTAAAQAKAAVDAVALIVAALQSAVAGHTTQLAEQSKDIRDLKTTVANGFAAADTRADGLADRATSLEDVLANFAASLGAATRDFALGLRGFGSQYGNTYTAFVAPAGN